MTKTVLGILAFFALYALADFLGGLMPEWVGYAILAGAVIACIAGIVKLGKVNR